MKKQQIFQSKIKLITEIFHKIYATDQLIHYQHGTENMEIK